LRKISVESGQQPLSFPADVQDYFRRAAQSLRRQIAKRDPLAQKIHAAYSEFARLES
jgi:hypothetical protein